MSFSSWEGLYKVTQVSSEMSMYTCNKCGFVSKSTSDINGHLMNYHVALVSGRNLPQVSEICIA